MAGGGHIIIRNKIADAGGLDSVKDQLGPIKKAKLNTLLAAGVETWSFADTYFVLKCIREALESYE